MKKSVILSLIAASSILANDVTLGEIEVNTNGITTISADNVSTTEVKNADLAEVLSKESPSINMLRRSGIANDITIRGMKRDNINVLIDDGKIYGACPNRMDPPTSHVLVNNIESVKVIEGPYDVENFGSLSSVVKINTLTPKEGFHGSLDLNGGSFGYKKSAASISGGTDKIKALLSMSYEESDQYKDGNGDTLAEQTRKNAPLLNQYGDDHDEMKAYEKKTALAKLYFNLSDNQDIRVSYTANRSDDVLYANTRMDALRDDSDIFDLKYRALELGRLSKELNVDYYHSQVEHPMATTYRNNGAMEMTNEMESMMQGIKIKNTLEVFGGDLSVGLDRSVRTWEGYYHNIMNDDIRDSIPQTKTENRAIFSEYKKGFGDLFIESGVRYDDTSIDTISDDFRDRDFEALSANVFATYKINNMLNVFAGIGSASRVPDARELYNISSMGANVGNENLDQTRNTEIDLGFTIDTDNANFKTKLFYSDLNDYIYYNRTNSTFENVDASIYGIELSGLYYITDELSLDLSTTYSRGKKDEALENQQDRDLADIAPWKGIIGLTYELSNHTISTKYTASKSWSSYDEDNGEKRIGGYGVLDLKYNYAFNKNFDITLGVDNIFDKTYAISNSYADIGLITSTDGETYLLNEPGRYGYLNLRYKF